MFIFENRNSLNEVCFSSKLFDDMNEYDEICNQFIEKSEKEGRLIADKDQIYFINLNTSEEIKVINW